MLHLDASLAGPTLSHLEKQDWWALVGTASGLYLSFLEGKRGK